jgi:nuclear pore complex protein Nup85
MGKEILSQPVTLQLGVCDSISQLRAANRTIKGTPIPMSSQVVVFATSREKQEHNTTGTFPQDLTVKSIQFQTIPVSRYEFLQTCGALFVEAEKEWEVTKDHDIPNKVATTSQKLQKQILQMVRGSTSKEATLFSALHSIWHLAHITCFDIQHRATVLTPLSEWVRLNFTADLVQQFEWVTKSADPTTSPHFWKIIQECVMRGYFDPAKQLLDHLDGEESMIQSFSELVSHYPRMEDFPTNPAFKQAWYKWHQDAVFALENVSTLGRSPLVLEQFTKLFSILAGVESVIINHVGDWHTCLLGLLHFVSPLHDVRNLSELTALLQHQFTEESILDQIQLALLEQDIGLVIGLCSQLDWWLVTHLIVMLDRMKRLSVEMDDAHTIREWYLSNFAEYLMTVPELQFTALEYFLACPTIGKAALDTVIPSMALGSKDDVKRMISFCKQHRLKETLKTVHSLLGKKALETQHYSEAVQYYLEAENFPRISFIVEKLLKKYELEGDTTFLDVASQLSPSALFKSPSLAFLTRYNTFKQLYGEKKYKEAADLVYMLFSSGSVPKTFWRMLLLDILPLLEGQVAVFSFQQVMELMRCVEAWTMSEQVHGNKTPDESLVILKMALARSLAATIVRNE